MSASVILHPGRDKSLRRKHPWIFSKAIKETQGKLRLGDTVDVLSAEGEWLAKGAWSPQSQIQVRVWSFDKQEVIDNGFFLRRLERAKAGRAGSIAEHGLTGYRLAAAESDGLPGITIDVYEQVIVCQLLSAGAEKHRSKIVWALTKLYPDYAILERSDVAVREKEGLAQQVQVLHGEVPDEVIIRENGHQLIVDLKHGHKTGFYLDQRDNRAMAGRYAKDADVLNCFSYTGTFGVYCMQGGAQQITHLDVSDNALATAKRNAELNHLDLSRCHFEKQDVFEALRQYRNDGRTFDMIILDPPKFVDSKASLNRACRGYKDINMLAMQILKPDGILLTFSCSGLMETDLFHKVVADAALDAGREIQYLHRLSQAADHPVLASYPEGYYLKGIVCRVL